MGTEEVTGAGGLRVEPGGEGPPRGALISRFLVIETLGAGGMGVVLSAYDPSLDRRVAIKLLRPDGGDGSGLASRAERLLREAQAMARISHPNVRAIYEVGPYEDGVFLAMEHVDGETLEGWMAAPRPWREVARAFTQAGRGLAAAHALGLVHRDFKPDNVLVGRDGRVLVTDFGVVSEARAPSETAPPAATPSSCWPAITRAGAVVGTPGYMAPEQRGGAPVDARADQYAFCVALRRALDGRMPRWMRPLVQRGLADAPGDRHPSLAALLAALERGPLVTSGRLLAVAAVAVAAVAVPLGWPARDEPCAGGEARLAGVWDAASRSAVSAAFIATRHAGAADELARVTATLDRYTGDWAAMRREACEATAVRKEQSPALLDLRMRCLDRRLGAVGALARVLAGADREVVARAAQAALALEPLAGCADGDALAAAYPPPADPQRRRWIDAVQSRLDRVDALQAAGKMREAYPPLPVIAEEARATRHPPVIARALTALVALERDRGRSDVVDLLDEAIVAAGAARDDGLVAWNLGRLMVVRSRGQGGDGLALRPALEAAAARAGDGEAARAVVHEALGEVYKVRGDLALAEQELVRARDLSTGAAIGVRLRVLQTLGEVLVAEGKLKEARAVLDLAIADATRTLGPDSLATAPFLTALGGVALHAHKHEEALVLFQRLVAIHDRAYGPGSVRAARMLSNVGATLHALGRYDEALATYRRALPGLEATGDANQATVARLHCKIGDTLAMKGDPAGAKQEYERALAMYDRSLPPDHPQVAETILHLAGVLGELGERAEELRLLGRAVEIREGKLGVEHDLSLEARLRLGRALLEDRARRAEGLAMIEKAWTSERRKPSESGELRAQLDFALAEALDATKKDPARAVELAREARALFVAVDGLDEDLARIDAWLARHP